MFDGLTGGMFKAELCSENVYTSKDVVAFIKPFFERYDKNHPEILMYVRCDSDFAVSELYDLLEEMAYSYVIRLESNKVLVAQSAYLEEALMGLCKEDMVSYKALYGKIALSLIV